MNSQPQIAPDAPSPSGPSPVLVVVAHILQAMRDGRLLPGQRLIETEYAQRLGLARPTVRQAFQRLESEGLLALERNRGFLVRMLSAKELQDAYEVREALDGMAARIATTKHGGDWPELDEIVTALRKACEEASLKDFTRLNAAFHDEIRRGAGNAHLSKVLSAADRAVQHYQFRLLVEAPHVFGTHDDHEEIYSAIKAGDAAKAEDAARRHVRRSMMELLALPPETFAA